MDIDQNEDQKKAIISVRLVGLVLFIAGIVVAGPFVAWPVYYAHNGGQDIYIYDKVIAWSLTFSCLGFNIFLFGSRAIDCIPDGNTNLKDIKVLYWVVLVVVVAVQVVSYFTLINYLDNLGFKIEHDFNDFRDHLSK